MKPRAARLVILNALVRPRGVLLVRRALPRRVAWYSSHVQLIPPHVRVLYSKYKTVCPPA